MTRRKSGNTCQLRQDRTRICNLVASLAGAVVCALGVGNAPADEGFIKPHEVTVVHNLPYRNVASRHCTLDLAYPKGGGEERRPAIVVIHGGGWLEGDKSSFVTETNRVPGNIRDYAALGFVAASINYRLSTEAPYPTGFSDCQCAVRWLRAHARDYHIDPNRIGAFGNSAGGHLALLLGLTEPADGLDEKGGPLAGESSRLQSVVSDSGPIDLLADHDHSSIKGVIERFMGGPPDAARRADYERASPINHLSGKIPPLMLIYGERDEQIDVRAADQFVATLGRARKADVSYFRLAAVRHCPYSLLRIPYLRPAVNEFFQRTLQLAPGSAKHTTR